MQVYWVTELQTGEWVQVDGDTVERLLGVEICYVDWVVEIDGVFENGSWTVRGKKFICLKSEPRKIYSESN